MKDTDTDTDTYRRKRIFRTIWQTLLLWSLCILAGLWLATRNVF
jgi:hypothetical protein